MRAAWWLVVGLLACEARPAAPGRSAAVVGIDQVEHRRKGEAADVYREACAFVAQIADVQRAHRRSIVAHHAVVMNTAGDVLADVHDGHEFVVVGVADFGPDSGVNELNERNVFEPPAAKDNFNRRALLPACGEQ